MDNNTLLQMPHTNLLTATVKRPKQMKGKCAEWKYSDCYRFAITHRIEVEEGIVRVQQEHKLLV